MLTIQELHSQDDFLAVESEWDDLLARSAARSFFLSHSWFRCCWPCAAAPVRPLVLLVRRNGDLVGAASFTVQTARWRRMPVRLVSLMQNQDTPFTDVIASRSCEEEVIAALLVHLGAKHSWHLLSFAKIRSGSTTAQVLEEQLSGRMHLRSLTCRSPLLSLEGGWESFWAGHSQRFKKTVRNVANRVRHLGEVTVEDVAQSADAEECFELFRRVAARSWKRDLDISVERSADVAHFFQVLTRELHARRRLRLWVLRLDGLPIATEYHVQDRDNVCALRADFDDRYREASVGTHLQCAIIRSYFDAGVARYDMGPGDGEYKRRWANASADCETFSIFRRSPYSAALYSLETGAVPRLKRARDWLSPERAAANEGE